MGQVSSTLRRGAGAYMHWCPGCMEMHSLPDGWTFDGNLEKPSFTPSFKHTGLRRVFTTGGNWTGEWIRSANREPVPFVCHYILTAGILHFCNDSSHNFAGQSVVMPKLPEGLTDDD